MRCGTREPTTGGGVGNVQQRNQVVGNVRAPGCGGVQEVENVQANNVHGSVTNNVREGSTAVGECVVKRTNPTTPTGQQQFIRPWGRNRRSACVWGAVLEMCV